MWNRNLSQSEGGPEFIETGIPCTRGHVAPRYKKFGGCVECVKENNAVRLKKQAGKMSQSSKEWRQKNKKYLNRQRVEYHARNPEKRMLASSKHSAETKGVPFDLEVNDIHIPDKCPVLGIKSVLITAHRWIE